MLDRRTLRLRRLDRPTRLDRALAEELAREHSRTAVARWIREGRVRVGGAPAKAALLVSGGEEVVVDIPEPPPSDVPAQAIPLAIVYEDDVLLVVDKPAGLVTHPAGTLREGTLVNALLHHVGTLSKVGGPMRAGIVHRLDKGTSGLLVVAKTDAAHRRLARSLKERAVSRKYEAIVWGFVRPAAFDVDAPIGRHPRDRKRMAVVEGGRPSRSHVRVLAASDLASRVEVELETGRTHQIRVHLAHRNHPVVGDAQYGGRRPPPCPGARRRAAAASLLASIDRPALHARELRFPHPVTGEILAFSSPLPADFRRALEVLASEVSAAFGDFR